MDHLEHLSELFEYEFFHGSSRKKHRKRKQVKVETAQEIKVGREINRARYMPQKPSVIAAKTNGSEVYVFVTSKRQLKHQSGPCNPDLRLRGHDKGGYPLSWSPFKDGYLLSGSNDSKLCLWDISAMPQDKVLEAMNVYEVHEDVVEHVSWYFKNENLFGSVGDDRRFAIYASQTSHNIQ